MASNCPKCGHSIDTQANFDCPKCGEEFWQSKESFLKREVKRSLIQDGKKKIRPKSPISTWDRLFISFSFSEYMLKGVASFGIIAGLTTLLTLTIAKGSSSVIADTSIYLILLYWLCITIGYIYGYVKYKDYNAEVRAYESGNETDLAMVGSDEDIKRENHSPKVKKYKQIHCPKCGKKVDDNSVYCIFCGSKIIVDHHEDKN